ncbi:MAG: endopeptidase La [Saprospiraceae bacterium]
MFDGNIMSGGGRDDQGDFLPMFSLDEEYNDPNELFDDLLPLLALKNNVLFPGVVIPITVGRDKSIKALKVAEKSGKNLVVVSQKDQTKEDPEITDLFDVAVVARVVKVLKMPDGGTTAILQGRKKVRLEQFVREEPYFEVKYSLLTESVGEEAVNFEALISTIRDTAKKIIELSPNIPSEAVMMLQNIKSPSFLLNFIASNTSAKSHIKQELLENDTLSEKANRILELLNGELRMLEIKDQIENKVRGDIEKQQRDYFLNQQLRTIQEELGGNPQEMELLELERRAKTKEWPEIAKKQFFKELTKAKRVNPQIAEYSVMLTYLEFMLELPWSKTTDDNFNLHNVKKVLDEDHYGLEDVKERILEHLAVLKLKGDLKAPILCLVGPPGVGKTSLGKSIAKALNREFIRMSLGGLHDESEIRGHRKTYIGAMPGRILKSMEKAGSSNPVFILDEIDKLGRDHRGDPSSALLEVLDPEQNSTFYDNYLEVEYDLSRVLFIATANSLSTVQPALLDRMEIIDVSGYSTEEKTHIAKDYLVPKQRKEHGLLSKDITLTPEVLEYVINNYTKESGVRSLDRTIASIMRNTAKKKAMDEKYKKKLSIDDVVQILGAEKFKDEEYLEVKNPGVAVGLAWTRVGGDILFIEASISKGKGKLTLTGNLGDVMKESASTALSFIKANAESMDIDPVSFENTDLHIHVPEGAIPKDGPSAGITMLCAIASAFKKKQIKPFLAMTGEITLRGKVLPVGGIKEKILAAKRAGIKEVMLCSENKKHIDKINGDFIKGMKFFYVDTMQQVLDHAVGFMRF